jgi:Ca2+-binding RTX toxin-like protein
VILLIGDAGDNRIDGLFGNDILTGNEGQDAFVFSTLLGDVDQITDFSVADDSFHLDSTAFVGLIDGALAADAFHVGDWWTADADDHIFYNPTTGALYHDADGGGLGTAAHVQFAQVSAGLAITHDDFLVV